MINPLTIQSENLEEGGHLIIDTDVLIWYLRGNKKAASAVVNAVPFAVSIVTYMELLKGMRDKKEMRIMKKAFAEMGVHIIPISETVSMNAASLVEKYFLSHSLELADALIAATCIENDEVLLTANDKHYRMIDDLKTNVFRP